MAQTVERGQQKRGCLAGTGLRRREQVAPREHLGDGRGLHGRGRLVAQIAHGGERRSGQPEPAESLGLCRSARRVFSCSHRVAFPFWEPSTREGTQGAAKHQGYLVVGGTRKTGTCPTGADAREQNRRR